MAGEDVMTTVSESAGILLARLDERTGGMAKTLERMEASANDRFKSMELELESTRKQIGELEAWRNEMKGLELEKQPKRIDSLEAWRDRIIGMGVVLGPLMTFGSAWLTKHMP